MSEKFLLIHFVKTSKRRFEILKILLKGSAMQKEIQNKMNIHRSNLSVLLSAMEKKGLIENKTPGVYRSPIYAITDLGREILRKIK